MTGGQVPLGTLLRCLLVAACLCTGLSLGWTAGGITTIAVLFATCSAGGIRAGLTVQRHSSRSGLPPGTRLPAWIIAVSAQLLPRRPRTRYLEPALADLAGMDSPRQRWAYALRVAVCTPLTSMTLWRHEVAVRSAVTTVGTEMAIGIPEFPIRSVAAGVRSRARRRRPSTSEEEMAARMAEVARVHGVIDAITVGAPWILIILPFLVFFVRA